jgi:hypothetical protein
MKLLIEWWRIKSASIPYSSIDPNFSIDFQKKVKDIVDWNNIDINHAFFPKVWGDIRTSLARQPLRPLISTHQWMPWNFYPFLFNDKIENIIEWTYSWWTFWSNVRTMIFTFNFWTTK